MLIRVQLRATAIFRARRKYCLLSFVKRPRFVVHFIKDIEMVLSGGRWGLVICDGFENLRVVDGSTINRRLDFNFTLHIARE